MSLEQNFFFLSLGVSEGERASPGKELGRGASDGRSVSQCFIFSSH